MTIKDIAKESGYAVGTVSRVLNNKTNVSEKAKREIMEIVDKHGFLINSNAKNLKQQASKNIVVLVKGVSNQLFASMIEKLQDEITKYGYLPVVEYFDEDDNEVEKALKNKFERKPKGFVFLGGVIENFEQYFQKVNLPSVVVTNKVDYNHNDLLSSVSVDDIESAKEAVDYLFERGHKNIGIIGGNTSRSDISGLRFRGVEKSFEEHGIKFDKEKQFQISRYSFKSAFDSMKKLIAKMPDVTAVFAMSDVMAIGASRAIFDIGKKVPDDISIVGFDGIDVSNYFIPRLTTIKQYEKEMATEAVRILINQIENHAKSERQTSKYSLQLGESVRTII